jgi:hypothetical protein
METERRKMVDAAFKSMDVGKKKHGDDLGGTVQVLS